MNEGRRQYICDSSESRRRQYLHPIQFIFSCHCQFYVWRSQVYYLWSKDRDKLDVLTSNGQFPFWRAWSCVCVFPWGSGSVRVQWDIDHLIKRGAFLQMLWSCNMKSEVPSPRILWLPPGYTHTKETFAETTKCLLNKSEEQYSVSWRIKKSLTLP